MSTEVEYAPVDGEVVDPATSPAMTPACDRCGEPALLRPGGICANCVAVVGLAADRAEYQAWRTRVEQAITAGP